MFYICTNLKRLASYKAVVIKFVLTTMLLLVSASSFGQRHELGVRMGMSNLVGDIGRTNYILQKPIMDKISEHGLPFYAGILYRLNFNPHQTLRFDFGYSHVQFDDRYAKEQYRRNRKWGTGTNSGVELDAIFEYYFFPVNEEQRGMLSPYIFGGIGGMFANVNKVVFYNEFKQVGGEYREPDLPEDFTTTPEIETGSKLIMSIPFGAGLKYKFNYNWALSGEFMFRPMFSDAIDYSVIDEKDVKMVYSKEILQTGKNQSYLNQDPYKQVAKDRADAYLESRNIGNKNSNDWVNSVTLSLTYSFGRPPCYCE